MAQHFLLTRRAKTLSLAQVFRMTDAEAETTFREVRSTETDGAPVCPNCGGLNAYECRRRMARSAFAAASARKISPSRRERCLPRTSCRLRFYLAAIAIFCNEVKGKAALALSRDICVSYKAAFVLAHKLREAMAEELKGRIIGGEGKEAEIDGALLRRLR